MNEAPVYRALSAGSKRRRKPRCHTAEHAGFVEPRFWGVT